MMDDLDKLIAAVEAGERWGSVTSFLAGKYFGLPLGMVNDQYEFMERAYHGSLDAAMRLHEALLPGWEWWVQSLHYWEGDEGPTAILRTGTPAIDLQIASARSATPARAWLLAILRAVKAKGE